MAASKPTGKRNHPAENHHRGKAMSCTSRPGGSHRR
jgi:hypothetical protein